MRWRVLVAGVAVASLGAAACGSRVGEDEFSAAYGFDQLTAPSGAAAGGGPGDGAGQGDAGASGDAAPASTTPGATPEGTGDGAAGEPGPAGAGGGDAGAAPGGGAAPTTGRVLPAPGRYTLQVSGTSALNGNPQPVPPTAEFVVEDLGEDRQRHRSPDPQGDTVQVLRATPEAVLLERMDLPAGKSFAPDEPVQYAPVPVIEGALWTWSMRSTDERTTIEHRSLVTGRETITVAGAEVDTFVLETVLTLAGDLRGTIAFTSWLSPEHGMVIRRHTRTDVSLGLFRLTADTMAELTSLTPA